MNGGIKRGRRPSFYTPQWVIKSKNALMAAFLLNSELQKNGTKQENTISRSSRLRCVSGTSLLSSQ